MQTEVRQPDRERARGVPGFVVAAVLLAMAVVSPVLFRGLRGALASNSNDPRQWLPRGFEETKKSDWLQRHFGNDEIAVVSWPGCTLADERAENLARALLENPDRAYFQRARTGARLLRRLTSAPLGLSYQEAVQRLQGVVIGADGATTCVVLTVSKRGAENRAAAIDEVRRIAERVCGLSPEQLRLGGPTVDAAAIDVESQRMLLELAGLSGIVALGISWIGLRSVRLAVIVLAGAVYSTMAAMAILYYTGGNMNLVMTMLPPLVFVLSLSTAIHLINYYRDALEVGRWQDAPVRALRDGWRPCLLSSATTAIGLLSLGVSEIVPVKMFGIYAAAGMGASLVTVLLFLPVALTAWPVRPRAAASNSSNPTRSPGIDRLADTICRHHAAIVIGMLLLMVVTAIGLPSLQSTVKLQYRFGSDSRILQDYRWLEEHLGPLVPLELVIHFPGDAPPSFPDQLEFVGKIEELVQQLPDVGAALSGADFAPAVPTHKSARDLAERVILSRRAPTIEASLKEAGFWALGESDERLWRISIRASALSNVDYGRFVETIRRKVEPFVTTVEGARVTYTGIIPLIYKAQRELLNDLVESFLLAFGVIALVMVVALRDIRSGLLAMIPNLFPVVVVFGFMGWCGIPVEIGSIMTASAAIGIAVDDTFHLLNWHLRGLRQQSPRSDAMRFALHRCAHAMMHTTLVCSFALLVFSLSSFMPIRRFAWMMASLLVAALVGDLLLMPAILAGPLGKLVRARRLQQPAGDSTAKEAQGGRCHEAPCEA
ncbi:MAG: efflux RND transporter permease subunit [Planctomycetota bacterium]